MGNTGERNPVFISPSSGNADENTVKLTSAGIDVSALTQRQKYVCQTIASETEQAQAVSIPFTNWMVTLDANPTKKEWEEEFNTRCAPLLEEMEVIIKSGIYVLEM